MKQVVYISYDLGFQGDFPKLYEWLDSHSAAECGDSFCRLIYDFKSVQQVAKDEDSNAMIEELRNDLKESINFANTDRVYAVSEFCLKGKTQMAGIFLIGRRKQSNPWDGASKNEESQGFDE